MKFLQKLYTKCVMQNRDGYFKQPIQVPLETFQRHILKRKLSMTNQLINYQEACIFKIKYSFGISLK